MNDELGARRTLSTATTEEEVATWPGVRTDEHGLAVVPRRLDGQLPRLVVSARASDDPVREPSGSPADEGVGAGTAPGAGEFALRGGAPEPARSGRRELRGALRGELRGALLSAPEPIVVALVPRRVQAVLVVDESHRPVAGVRVELCTVSDGDPADAATTDADGWAHLDEPLIDILWFADDPWRVHVAGLLGATVAATGDASHVLEPAAFGAGAIVLVAPETGSVEARFEPAWPAGDGLSALLLCPVAPDGSRVPTPLRLVATFVDGRVRFDGVAFGLPLELGVGTDPAQKLALAPLSRETPRADVAVPPGRTPSTVRGRLVDGATGAPLRRVAARFEELVETAYTTPRGLDLTTGDDGSFECAPSVAALTAVRFALADGSASSALLSVTGWPHADVDLGDVPVRSHARGLALRLTSGGAPVPGARVRVFAHRRADGPLTDAERALAVRVRLAGAGADWSRLPADEVWLPAVPAHGLSDLGGVVRASALHATERWLVHVEGAGVADGWHVLDAPSGSPPGVDHELALELETRGELVGTCLVPDWLDGDLLAVVAVGATSGARHGELDRTFPPRATDVSPRGTTGVHAARGRLVRFEDLPPEPYGLEFHVAEHLRPLAELGPLEARPPGSGFHPGLDPLDLRAAFAGLDLEVALDPAADFAGHPPEEVAVVARSGATRRLLWSGGLVRGACKARVVVGADQAADGAVELLLEAAGAAPVPLALPAPGALARAAAVLTPGPLVEVEVVRPVAAPVGAALALRLAEGFGTGSGVERVVLVQEDGRARFHVAGPGPLEFDVLAFVDGEAPDDLPVAERTVVLGGEPVRLELAVPAQGLVHRLDLADALLVP